ncbi:MAG: cyclic nucleotide-binding protein [Alteromonadaceae bacterium]|nr:cyclic nucleotide-binding protein [Alteromonadaceae bacterium]
MILNTQRVYMLTMALVVAMCNASAQAVSLTNPSFENNWEGWSDTDPSSISSLSYDGNRSAKITGANGRFEQNVSIDANANYRLSAFVRGKGRIGVTSATTNMSQSAGNSNWTQVSLEFASGDATSITIYGEYFSGEGRFDDFQLIKLSSEETPDNGQPISCLSNLSMPIVSAVDDGTNDGNGPESTIDNNLTATSRWSSFGIGKTITYDLGTSSLVKDISIAWHKGDQRTAFFEVETSTDSSSWSPVLSAGQSSGTSLAMQNYPLLESSARYVRIVGQGNSSSDWNSILETQIFGCAEGTGDVPIDNGDNETLDPTLPPSGNFELVDWTLSVPIDDNNDGKADTTKELGLSSGYELNPYFYTGADGGLVFRSLVEGSKTSTNTSYTRSELREMLRRGDTSYATKGVNGNNWVFSSAPSGDKNVAGGIDGVLEATLAVNHVTTTGSSSQVGRVIIGQIHANDDEPVRIYYRKLPGNSRGAIYFAHEPNGGSDQYYEMIGSRSSSAANPADGIELNERFSYRIQVSGNTLTVTIMRQGKPDIVETADMTNSGYDVGGQYMYFKAGVYNLNNTGDANDYAQATFYKI